MQQQPQTPVQQSRMSPTQMPTMHQNPYHPPQNAFANGNPYGMQSASPHSLLYGYGYKAPSYATTMPYAVSPLPSPYAMAYPIAGHLTSRGAPQIQPQQNLQSRQTTRSEKAHEHGRPRVATAAAHVANPSSSTIMYNLGGGPRLAFVSASTRHQNIYISMYILWRPSKLAETKGPP